MRKIDLREILKEFDGRILLTGNMLSIIDNNHLSILLRNVLKACFQMLLSLFNSEKK